MIEDRRRSGFSKRGHPRLDVIRLCRSVQSPIGFASFAADKERAISPLRHQRDVDQIKHLPLSLSLSLSLFCLMR